MKSIPRPEALKIQAAEGWLMLSNPFEANEELEQISPEYRMHPAVLAMKWQVYAAAEWWEAAWVVSKALCDLLPESAEVWICQANTLRRYRGLRDAADLLETVLERFPDEAVCRYNLACYEAQLGNIDDASSWLVQAFELPNSMALKLAAVYDPDLQPLWERLGQSAFFGGPVTVEVGMP
jgi:predicted Zn-dependent protease